MKLLRRLLAKVAVVEDASEENLETTVRRVRMLPDTDMWLWADNLVSSLGQNVQQAVRGDTTAERAAALAEAELGTQALRAIIEEMQRRVSDM